MQVQNTAEYKKNFPRLWKRVVTHRTYLLMLIPGLTCLIIFSYIPMYGIIIAFKDFQILKGILYSPWVGLKYFDKLFSDAYFYVVLRNTLLISIYKLLWGFPIPILFALLLNEINSLRFKKLVQTVSYLPYFMSWVVLGGIFTSILSLDGPINSIMKLWGRQPVIFLSQSGMFRGILVITDVWKGFGWGSIIYLAALSGIDVQMYEAAIIDGASKYKQVIYITLPSLAPVIVIMLILNMSGILNAGFDQVFNLYNPSVMDVGDIIDTYVYRKGLLQMEYSYSTAVGLFKSLVALVMVVITNFFSNRLGGSEYGLW